MEPGQALWAELRKGDVYPLPLATATRWTDAGWVVDVVMVQTLTATGYSIIPIFTHREPVDRILGRSGAESERVTAAATAAFVIRLSQVLEQAQKSSLRRYLADS